MMIGLIAGCQTDTKQKYKLMTNDRRRLDTLYRNAIDSLRPALDEECAHTREARIKLAVDSLLRQRLAEEARLRQRLQQQQSSD